MEHGIYRSNNAPELFTAEFPIVDSCNNDVFKYSYFMTVHTYGIHHTRHTHIYVYTHTHMYSNLYPAHVLIPSYIFCAPVYMLSNIHMLSYIYPESTINVSGLRK